MNSPPSAPFTIALLGTLQVSCGEQVLVAGVLSKPWAVLAYMAVEAQRSHRRDELAALFWPDQPSQRARQNLRWAIASLRRELESCGAEFLLVERETIQLDPRAVSIDLQRFEQVLGQPTPTLEELHQVVGLYRGELLRGFEQHSVGETLSNWLTTERERVQRQVRAALSQLAERYLATDDLAAAAEYAERLLALDPWNEPAYRVVIATLARSGRRSEALLQFERCRRVLAEELGISPEPATVALYEQIRNGEVSSPTARLGESASSGEERLVLAGSPEDALPAPHPLSAPAPQPNRYTLGAPVNEAMRNRSRMLDRVERFWINGFLSQAITRGPLALEGSLHHPPAAAQSIMIDEAGLLTAFDRCDGELLILGAAGAGKTIALLRLARALLERARGDLEHPLPIIFSLASWQNHYPSLLAWLTDELHARYQVPRRIGHSWLESGQVLPLLDGLDELANSERSSCITALQHFREQFWLVGMVITCRSAVAVSLNPPLRLQAELHVQPLALAVVVAELQRHGAPALAAQIASEHTLAELARAPLALNALLSRAQHGSFDGGRDLVADYAEQLLSRSHSGERQALRRDLRWLARSQGQHHSTIFHLEELQPTWLAARQQRRYHLYEGLCIGASAGLVAGLDEGLRLVLAAAEPSFASALLLGSSIGIGCGGLVGSWPPPQQGRWARLLRDSRPGLIVGATYALTAGLLFGPLIGVAVGSVIGVILIVTGIFLGGREAIVIAEAGEWQWQRALQRLPIAATVGVVAALLLGALYGPGVAGAAFVAVSLAVGLGIGSAHYVPTARPNAGEGIRRSARRALRWALGLALLVGASFALGVGFSALGDGLDERLRFGQAAWQIGLLNGIGPALVAGLAGAYFFGGLAWLRHHLVRRLLAQGRTRHHDLAHSLERASELALLRRVGGGYLFAHSRLRDYFAQDETHQ